jgi:hypothetical protein
MATENAGGIHDIESALDSIIDPALTEPEQAPEEETPDEATEEDEETHSEETDEEEETEEPEGEPESDESEGESETEDDEQDSEVPAADLHTVTVDGEPVQVDLNELKRGYSGQQYVQKGMKAAAEARKQAEDVYGQLQQERQRIGQVLQMIEAGQLSSPPVEPDKAMFESDPIGYMEARIAYDEQLATYQQQMGTLQQYAQQQTAADQKAQEAYLMEQAEQLKVSNPDWADPAKAATMRETLMTGGDKYFGYSTEELAAVTDHRAITVLQDAIKWRELQENAPKAKKRVTKGVAKKARRRKPTTAEAQRRKQKDRLKRTGSIDDAIGLLFE